MGPPRGGTVRLESSLKSRRVGDRGESREAVWPFMLGSWEEVVALDYRYWQTVRVTRRQRSRRTDLGGVLQAVGRELCFGKDMTLDIVAHGLRVSFRFLGLAQ